MWDSTIVRVGVEEDNIKFRPSPNFKNMKKFLKNRSDYNETTTLALAAEPVSPNHRMNEKKPVVQPPLPPYPPPPDSPLDVNITIKQEREDEETPVANNGDENVGNQNLEPPQAETDQQLEERPKQAMCKEYIRGECKRSVCRFSHEVDITQLRGVFTFCWNYQNAVCTYPSCKFVHATVFEEAEFYRTGTLPPHARAHVRRPMAPPPPPEETQPDMPANFVNPPPHHSVAEKQLPVINCMPTSIEAIAVEDELRIPRSNSPLKREWSDLDDFSSSPRDLESKEHLTKKCKKCDLMELSVLMQEEKVERTSDEVNKKVGQLNKKSHKLITILQILMKPSISAKSVNSLIVSEKEKNTERFSNYISSNNNRLSFVNEDIKNILGSNITLTNLMAKLLCSKDDRSLPSDNSREA